MRRLVIVVLVWLSITGAAQAWDGPGHMVAARIAYERLSPATRNAVDSLLTNHPYYNRWITTAQSVVQPAQVNEAVFMLAATWPDEIRDDPQFYDDVKHEQPTPQQPGYPNMARHTNWHFVDIPFSQDGTPTPSFAQTDHYNAVFVLNHMYYDVNHSANRTTKVYDLPWILHLVGDIHQPLHCANRFSRQHPSGDAGGNGFVLGSGRKLHSYWDGLIAPGYDYHSPDHSARDLATAMRVTLPAMNAASQSLLSHRKPSEWALESFKIATMFVYSVGSEVDRPNPSAEYAQSAHQIAEQRILLAGFRLAALLSSSNLN